MIAKEAQAGKRLLLGERNVWFSDMEFGVVQEIKEKSAGKEVRHIPWNWPIG